MPKSHLKKWQIGVKMFMISITTPFSNFSTLKHSKMIKPLIYNTAILFLLLSPLSLPFHIPSPSKNLKTQSQSSDLRSATSDLPAPVHDEVQKANSFLTDDAMERAEAGSKEEKVSAVWGRNWRARCVLDR